MAADAGRRLDVANLLSFGDDLVGVLLDRTDAGSLAQAYDGARMLRSACHSESGDLKLQVKGPFSVLSVLVQIWFHVVFGTPRVVEGITQVQYGKFRVMYSIPLVIRVCVVQNLA
jgi:hypothetical protein